MNSFRRPVLSSAISYHCVPTALPVSDSNTHPSTTLRAEKKRRIESGGCPLCLVALSVMTARTCRYSRALDSESAGWRPNLVRRGAASLCECRAESLSLGSDVLQPWPGPMAAAGPGVQLGSGLRVGGLAPKLGR